MGREPKVYEPPEVAFEVAPAARVAVGVGEGEGEAPEEREGEGEGVGEGDGVLAAAAEQLAAPSGATVPAGQGRHAAALVAAPAAKVFTGQGVHTLEAPYQPKPQAVWDTQAIAGKKDGHSGCDVVPQQEVMPALASGEASGSFMM